MEFSLGLSILSNVFNVGVRMKSFESIVIIFIGINVTETFQL